MTKKLSKKGIECRSVVNSIEQRIRQVESNVCSAIVVKRRRRKLLAVIIAHAACRSYLEVHDIVLASLTMRAGRQ